MENDVIIESLEEKFGRIIDEAVHIAYEHNPSRQGWDCHTIECDFLITNEADQKADVYYMIECYCDDYSELIDIVEGLPMWVETYLSGKCSLRAQLEVYTSEKLEVLLDNAEKTVATFRDKRNAFMARQQLSN